MGKIETKPLTVKMQTKLWDAVKTKSSSRGQFTREAILEKLNRDFKMNLPPEAANISRVGVGGQPTHKEKDFHSRSTQKGSRTTEVKPVEGRTSSSIQDRVSDVETRSVGSALGAVSDDSQGALLKPTTAAPSANKRRPGGGARRV